VHKTDKAIQKSMELLPNLKYLRMLNPNDANDDNHVEVKEEIDNGMEGGMEEDGMESDDKALLDPEEAVEENMVVRQHLLVSKLWIFGTCTIKS
jgi:hypothetical protein